MLPIVAVSLMLVQQKWTMPPPTDDQQAQQQKMMKYMMVFMGLMFYKVASGLCIYFIASSMWGFAERQLLPKKKPGARAAGRGQTAGRRPVAAARPQADGNGSGDNNGRPATAFPARASAARASAAGRARRRPARPTATGRCCSVCATGGPTFWSRRGRNSIALRQPRARARGCDPIPARSGRLRAGTGAPL